MLAQRMATHPPPDMSARVRSTLVYRKLFHYLTTPMALLMIVGLAVALTVGLIRRHNQQVAARQRLIDCRIDQKLKPAPVSTGSPTVVVLGDGLADGFGLPRTMNQAWPALLGSHTHWRIIVNGDARSGFLAGGFCGHERFATRLTQVLAAHPALVIVEGGTNDVARAASTTDRNFQAHFRTAAVHLLRRLTTATRVVVIGPLPTSHPASATEQRLNQDLAHAAKTAGATYISALHWQLPQTPTADQTNPETQASIAAHIQQSLPAALPTS